MKHPPLSKPAKNLPGAPANLPSIRPWSERSGCDLPAAERRVLILMSDTGGGHRAAAEAVQEGLEALYGQAVAVTVIDAWREQMAWPVRGLAFSYGWILQKALWLWKLLWVLEKRPVLAASFFRLLYPLVGPPLLRLFQSQRPGVIVSVHPLLTQFSLLALERTGLDIPFVTVVTDMIDGWRVWYRPSTTLCLVPSPQIRRQALRMGLAPAKIEVVGQPVTLKLRPDSPQKQAVRRRLGLDPARPVILLAGGGEGYGPLFSTARCLARRLEQVQLLIVAGRNRPLQRQLEAVAWEVPTQVFGFVDNMPDLMTAADLFVTKAGPGSLNEAFVAGLPLIICAYIPGQEDKNVRYVQQHQAGVYLPEPEAIAARLQQWLQPGDPTLPRLAQNAANLARPQAALTIARRVYGLIPPS